MLLRLLRLLPLLLLPVGTIPVVGVQLRLVSGAGRNSSCRCLLSGL